MIRILSLTRTSHPARMCRIPLAGLALVFAGLLAGCGPTAPPEAPAPGPDSAAMPEPGQERAEPRRPLTETRPITDMPRRTFGFDEAGVWISNELEGGRVSDAILSGDTLILMEIHPENAPINNSAWYAFKAWSRAPRTIDLKLVYEDGDHRYWPKTRTADGPWTPMDSALVTRDTAGTATLTLRLSPDTLWVAGQEMLTSTFFDGWTDSLAALPWATRRTIATSPRGRPIRMLEMGDTASGRHVVIISRQHPPEVSGTWALLAFVETLAGDTELARRFRDAFRVHVVPLVNPDGVDLGHWRHNTGGIDLNRDWGAFLQPETRAVAEEIRRILADPDDDLWFAFDFHSTQYDVFYTLDRSFVTDPPGLTDRWLGFIDAALYLYDVNDSPSGLQTPTSRNWFYVEFGAPALIYEVGDETPRPLIRQVAETAAEGTMRILLDAMKEADG